MNAARMRCTYSGHDPRRGQALPFWNDVQHSFGLALLTCERDPLASLRYTHVDLSTRSEQLRECATDIEVKLGSHAIASGTTERKVGRHVRCTGQEDGPRRRAPPAVIAKGSDERRRSAAVLAISLRSEANHTE